VGLQMLGFGFAFTLMGLAVLSVVTLTSGILVALGLRLAVPERR
jgi:hypothetical protein